MRKQQRLQPGDKVSHKGQSWIVVADLGGLVKNRQGEEKRTVRVNQVRAI